MRVIAQETAWFTSDAGKQAYLRLKGSDEKALFIYSYLRQIVNATFLKGNILFKFAFFLADAVGNSTLSYAEYPALIDPKQNPFMTYITKCSKYKGEIVTYLAMLAILQGKADPKNDKEWIYNENLTNDDHYLLELSKIGCNYLSGEEWKVVDPTLFEVEESLKMIVLEIYWIFGQIKGV